jgi:glycosyltransferase involved in cell wall biosynthesis
VAPGCTMKLVISAVNFTEGGPLTVLREIVRTAAAHFPDWTLYVLVHAQGTVNEPRVIELPFPTAKRSWVRRLLLEWFGFKRLSRELQPDVWLSLHDITPRVEAGRQYVYCHNPAPFCTVAIPGEQHDPRFMLFRRFYSTLYRCFIHRNAAVIVQQEWLRQLFVERFGARRVIVAHPEVSEPKTTLSRHSAPSRFLYPAFPRVFKNFEVLGKCAVILESDPLWTGEIVLTIDGSENSYADEIRQRFGHLRTLRFTGLQQPHQMAALYEACDVLLFPSLLETWGLPLTEAKVRGMPILAASLPYAHETVGSYDRVDFFDPQCAEALSEQMLGLHIGTRHFGSTERVAPTAPYANGWRELLAILLVEDQAPAAVSSTS